MTGRTRRRYLRATKGFTLIELLIVVVVIGILAGIAIPVFLHQKAAARNAAVDASLSTIAKTIEALDVEGSLARTGSGTTLHVNGQQAADVPVAGDIGWNVSGTTHRYCLVAYSTEGGKHTASTPRTYDSAAGGTGHRGAACSTDPARTPVAFPVDTTGPAGGINLIPDSAFKAVSFPPSTTNVGPISAYMGSYFETVDVPTPVGERAVKVTARFGDRYQGVIFFQNRHTIDDPVVIKEAGETWSMSIWVKGTAGRSMYIAPRMLNGKTWTYVREVFMQRTLPSSDWVRLTGAYTTTPEDVGRNLALEATWHGYTAVGDSFLVAGPQLERADEPSAFQPTLPLPPFP